MASLRTAVLQRIKADGPTAALLDVYAGGAAVFPREKAPDYEWAEMPGVIVRDPTMLDDKPAFSAAQGMADGLISVAIYGQLPANSNDDEPVQLAAKSIRNLFRGVSFVDTDGIRYQANASGPIAAPVSTPELTGMIVQLRINVGD